MPDADDLIDDLANLIDVVPVSVGLLGRLLRVLTCLLGVIRRPLTSITRYLPLGALSIMVYVVIGSFLSINFPISLI